MDQAQLNLIAQLFSSQSQRQQQQGGGGGAANSVASLPSTEALKAVLQSVGATAAGAGGGGPSGIGVTTYSDAQASCNAQHQNQSTSLSSFRIPKKPKAIDDTSARSGSSDDWMIEVYDAPAPVIQSRSSSGSQNEHFHHQGQSIQNSPSSLNRGIAPDFSKYGDGMSAPADSRRRESRDRDQSGWQNLSNNNRNQQRRSSFNSDDVTKTSLPIPIPKNNKAVRSVQGLRVPTSLSELVPRYDLLTYLKKVVTDFRRTWRHNYRSERHWNGWAYNFRLEARDKLCQMCGGADNSTFSILASYLDNKLAMKVHTGVQKSKKSKKRKRRKGQKKGVGHYMVEKQYDCHHGFKSDYRPDKHDIKVMREINRVLNDEHDEDPDL